MRALLLKGAIGFVVFAAAVWLIAGYKSTINTTINTTCPSCASFLQQSLVLRRPTSIRYMHFERESILIDGSDSYVKDATTFGTFYINHVE